MNVLVTGALGFIGRNLICGLQQLPHIHIMPVDQDTSVDELKQGLNRADFVIHLAGVNRPKTEAEFQTGNVGLTEQICQGLLAQGRGGIPILFSSSTQAELDNPYGASKKAAEDVISRYAEESRSSAIIYRLTNVFGKWSRPEYNSVVSTFCYNTAHDLPLRISDPNHTLHLVHIDDVVDAFLQELASIEPAGMHYKEVKPIYSITLGQLAMTIQEFRQSRKSLRVPDFSEPLTHKLYGTYLSYLGPTDFAYDLEQRCDPRGCLAEFVKAPPFGQIFVSRTKPGIIRGNHYHHAKTEKFLVLEGEAIIRFRQIEGDEILEYPVRGEDFRVVDIPPGYTHSIENTGTGELVTLFWASEIFDPEKPDTVYLPVGNPDRG